MRPTYKLNFLEQNWNMLESALKRKGTPKADLDKVRLIYLAGASSMFDFMTRRISALPDDEGVQELERINQLLDREAARLQKEFGFHQ